MRITKPGLSVRRPTRLALTLGIVVTALISGCGADKEPARKRVALDESRNETLHAMLPDSIKKAGVVRVATNAPFPPYEMFESPGSKRLTGLEIDLGTAIGNKLGVRFDFSQQPFDGLIPGLQARKYDLLMAALFDTKEREKQIDFVTYARSGSAILVPKGNPDKVGNLTALCGRTVGVQNGSTQAKLLEKHNATCSSQGKPAIVVRTYPQFSDEQLALNSKKIGAIVGDLPVLSYTVKQAGSTSPFEIVSDPAAPHGYDFATIGIGVPKNETKLRDALKQAVQQLMDNGTYRKILDSYGVSQTAIDTAAVNQQAS